MTTGSDDALDVALGLLRAPALRGTLRARPLPDGMGELLAIASGSVDRARAAASRTGHDYGELLEASRFYVQQVLLAEGADAYRVLGVARGAEHAEIRDHHRLLLRWLHPDRNEGAQWESAFATRVNAAWTQLRSGEAMADYDAQLDAAAGQGATPSPFNGMRARPRGVRLEGDAPTSRAGPFAVAGLGLACVALAWLAVQREGELDRLRDAPTDLAAGVSADALSTPAPAQSQASTQEVPSLSQRVSALVEAAQQRASTPPAAADIAPSPPVARTAEQPPATAAMAGTRVAQRAAALSPIPALTAPAPAASLASTASAPKAATPPATPPIRRAEPAPQDTSAISIAHAAASSRIAVAEESPAALAYSDATPAATSRASSATQSNSTPSDPLQLMREAEATVGTLTAYLTRTDAPAPAFLDPAIRLQAAGVRNRLHARLDARQRRSMQIEAPAWTLDDRRAALLGAYRIQAARGTQETGLLRLQLARDNDAWRVSELQLEPAR
ncbi:DnaJ domain-containing protein [Luteimonas sp. MC1782]|uniref:DnaJ domain-containing protein n=1 Tax=Luteimonas sp. MC1782 TaxID=2760305 RepID=UPI0015FFAC2B|nr:DnaJ domain-containing protein [Luteimonas sp. MC1782]MBB1472247.1 DnaJ domain-containing protein [Luteimonas sp. MC1782]